MGYNEKAFTPEDVEQGLMNDLLNYLLDYNTKSKEYFYDIHITSDGYCTIVQWTDISYNSDGDESKFDFVDYDEVVMKELILPDNSIIYVHRGEQDEALKEWLEDNPSYKQDEYGRWYNEDEVVECTNSK